MTYITDDNDNLVEVPTEKKSVDVPPDYEEMILTKETFPLLSRILCASPGGLFGLLDMTVDEYICEEWSNLGYCKYYDVSCGKYMWAAPNSKVLLLERLN